MREYLQEFRKSSALEATFFLMKKVWKQQILLTIIVGIVSYGIAFLLIGSALMEILKQSQDVSNMFNPQAQMEKNMMMRDLILNNGQMFILLILIALLIYCIYYVLSFKINESFVKENKFSSEIVFKNLMSNSIKILGLNLMLFLIMLVTFIAIGLIIALISALKMVGLVVVVVLISIFVVFIFLGRFGISYTALINGQKDIIESIKFSYKNLTIKRVILSILFVLVISIGLSFLMMPLGFLLREANVLNLIIYFGVSIIINSITYLFVSSAMSVLYYRYSDDETNESDITEHLVQ